MASTSSSSASNWLQTHRRAALIAAAVATTAAVGVAGVAYYRTTQAAGARGAEADGATKGEGEGKSKKKKKKSKATGGPGGAGSKASAEEAAGQAGSNAGEEASLKLTRAEIEVMDPDQRGKLAHSLKARGNKLYSGKQFAQAIAYYSKAIECEEQAVFYSNRAACYTNLNELDKVVDDCSAALRLDPSYIKALNRRATAREQQGGLEPLYLALCDFTAAAIIDNFQTEATQVSVERVMKRLATDKAQAILQTREARLPSATFIKAYLEAFRAQPAPPLPPSPSQGDRTLALAFEALGAKDYTHAFTLFHEALEQGPSTARGQAEALNMRATFRFIMSEAPGALEDLDKATALYPEGVQAWVKKASVHMELGLPEQAFADFDRALEIDPQSADVFYHRGQVYFITGDYPNAIAEYRKSSEVDPAFIFSHIQLAVAQYKSGETEKALAQFRRFLTRFADAPEVFNYYGELLLDQQKFPEAVENFEKAVALDHSSPPNVLPRINRALALFQWKQDFAQAEQICREAIAIDPQCDVGVATLAQLLLQQNKVHEAVGMFQRSAEMSRTEPELINALTFENATRAQIAFIEAYPAYAERLGLNRNADNA